ncbi:MAG: EAL domain-containing protein [Pseudomonadota bacterium]
MFTSAVIEKSFDDFNKITELSKHISISLQNYTAARTVIRDYVISMDEKYYAQVNKRVAHAIEALTEAESFAEQLDVRSSINQLRDSMRIWNAIASKVRDAFANYQETIQSKVLANFYTLTRTDDSFFKANVPLMSGIVMDIQAANAAITGYLMNGGNQLAENALSAIEAAKEKVDRAVHVDDTLQLFASHLNVCAEGLQEAIGSRKNAYHLLHDHLSPLGIQIQSDAELLHQQIFDTQRKNDEIGLALKAEMRHAVEHDELVLYYQPKINLYTGEMNHVEAVVRWIHPTRGFISPDEFIPFAESTGCITAITRFVIDRALRQCAEWKAKGLLINISVNMSVRDLLDPELPEWVGSRIEEHKVLPQSLTLEITESAIMGDPARSEKVLQALRSLGLRLSIDDFGTGYSSLAYLKRIRAQELKIDKSFVMEMIGDRDSVTIVRSTIDLGHNMGLKVVAEGVENKAVMDLLAALGCDFAQGYFISKPIPAIQLEQWIAANPNLTVV